MALDWFGAGAHIKSSPTWMTVEIKYCNYMNSTRLKSLPFPSVPNATEVHVAMISVVLFLPETQQRFAGVQTVCSDG